MRSFFNSQYNSLRSASIVFAISFGLIATAQAQTTVASQLEQEVDRMMNAHGWPRMIRIALDRGDLQRAALGRLDRLASVSPECLNQKYTQERVLGKIRLGQMQIYSDPEIVAGIARFHESQAGKRILDKVAERAKQVGAATAYLESKESASKLLTPEEAAVFAKFADSPAGKAYIKLRDPLLRALQVQLATLADEVGYECRNELTGLDIMRHQTKSQIESVVQYCRENAPEVNQVMIDAYAHFVSSLDQAQALWLAEKPEMKQILRQSLPVDSKDRREYEQKVQELNDLVGQSLDGIRKYDPHKYCPWLASRFNATTSEALLNSLHEFGKKTTTQRREAE